MSSSIADEITRLSGCRNDILSAISSKGVTVPADAVLSSCPALIDSIQTGGGSQSTLYNTAFTGYVTATGSGQIRASQKAFSAYDYTDIYPVGNGTGYYSPSTANATAGMMFLFDTSVTSIRHLAGAWNPMTSYSLMKPTAYITIGIRFASSTSYLARSAHWAADIEVSTATNIEFSGIARASDIEQLNDYLTSVYFTPGTFQAFIGFELRGRRNQLSAYTPNTANCSITASAATLTGTSYPYPDRPAVEYLPVTVSATGSEYITTSSATYFTATGNRVEWDTGRTASGSSKSANYGAQFSGIVVGGTYYMCTQGSLFHTQQYSSLYSADYPSSAYNFSGQPVSPTVTNNTIL